MRSSHSSRSRSHSSMHSHRSSSLTSHHMHHSNSIGHSSLRNRPGHHHGISDAHAFAVGRATGVNINASASGAAGAALHRSSERRRRRRRNSSSMSDSLFNTNNSFSDNNSTENVNFENMTEEEIREFFENNPLNVGKGSFFMLIPVLIFFVIFIVMIIFMFTRFF